MSTMLSLKRCVLFLSLFVVLMSSVANATIVQYNDQATYEAALASLGKVSFSFNEFTGDTYLPGIYTYNGVELVSGHWGVPGGASGSDLAGDVSSRWGVGDGGVLDTSGFFDITPGLSGLNVKAVGFLIGSRTPWDPTLYPMNITINDGTSNVFNGVTAGFVGFISTNTISNALIVATHPYLIMDNLILGNPIPEPATLSILSLGIVGLLRRRSR